MGRGGARTGSLDLAVQVDADEVAFMVNGAIIHTLPSAEVDTSGVVGLRINHMLAR